MAYLSNSKRHICVAKTDMYLEVQIFWVFNVLKKFQENLFGKGDMA